MERAAGNTARSLIAIRLVAKKTASERRKEGEIENQWVLILFGFVGLYPLTYGLLLALNIRGFTDRAERDAARRAAAAPPLVRLLTRLRSGWVTRLIGVASAAFGVLLVSVAVLDLLRWPPSVAGPVIIAEMGACALLTVVVIVADFVDQASVRRRRTTAGPSRRQP